MQLYIKLNGVKELMKQLDGTERGIVIRMMRSGLRKVAKPVLETAKRLVPYSGGKKYDIKTGKRVEDNWLKMKVHLRDMLKIRAMRRKKGQIGVIVGTSDIGFTGMGFYGSFLELGTSKMVARPFLRPAFDSNKDFMEAVMKEELDAALIMALASSGRMGEAGEGVVPVLEGEMV